MIRACIHLGMHNHPVSNGICLETLNTIFGLIAQEVSKTPTAKKFTIAMATSKEILDKYLIHNGIGPKKMLRGQELEDILDKFEHLSSPNLQNTISLSRSSGKKRAYDSIMAMQRYTTIEYIHSNIFLGQGKDKVYVFKMLVDGPGSGVDSLSICSQEEIWRMCGSCLTMSSVSKNGPLWRVTCTMQHIARS
jgi:hypothetical protein